MKTVQRNTILYGIYGFLGIAAYFLLMKLFGLENVTELRLFNIAIIIISTNLLARKNVREGNALNYVESLGSLILANFITVGLSVLGFLGYIKVLDQTLLSSFENRFIANGTFEVWAAAAILFLEGLASALTVAFISMQYWKRYENQME